MYIIILGTSGSLNKDIDLYTFLVSKYTIGFDGLAHFYLNENVLEKELEEKFINHTKWDTKHAFPYAVKTSDNLLNKFNDINKGITLTATGFYAPQSRELRLKSSIKSLDEMIKGFIFKDCKITNFEMETSALYFLGKSLGHNTLTICAILGNRLKDIQSKKPYETIDRLIDLVIDRL